MALRYYLHGDQKEGDPNLFFCRRCDLFKPEKHFHEEHLNSPATDFELLLQTKKELTGQSGRSRPSKAGNLFD
jgi:hypothetical protein